MRTDLKRLEILVPFAEIIKLQRCVIYFYRKEFLCHLLKKLSKIDVVYQTIHHFFFHDFFFFDLNYI